MKNGLERFRQRVLFLLSICFLSPLSFAINVMPFSGELDLLKHSNYKFSVSNRSNSEAAVKISVLKWEIDQFGQEFREPNNDLIVFPRQMLLSANGERSVRVSYRHGVMPSREYSYRIVVEEVPLEKIQNSIGLKGASINVLTRYVTAFYVKPVDALSKINVLESSPTEYGFQLKVRNDGNAHTHIIQPVVSIRQTGQNFLVTDIEMLKPFANSNILALADRIFDWEIPESLRQSLDLTQAYKVSIEWNCENCTQRTNSITFVVE